MIRIRRGIFLLIVTSVLAAAAQEESSAPPPAAAPAAKPHIEIFSGTITELSDARLAVVRRGSNKNQPPHSFILDANTKVEGKLRLQARVSVGYTKAEDGDHVVRIIVR